MNEIPRTTEIISPWVDDLWFDETSRERGTDVHRIISSTVRDLWAPIGRARQGYIDSFQAWFDAMVIRVLYCEGWQRSPWGEWIYIGPLISKLGWSGLPDFIGLLKGEDLNSIVDWKTSVSKQKVWQLQVGGSYRLLAEENGFGPIGRCLSLRLDRDGGQAKVGEYGSPMDAAFFLRAFDLWRFFHEI